MADTLALAPSGSGVVETAPAVPGDLASLFWRPTFPTRGDVAAAADTLPDQPCGHLQEGPSWRISVSPGKVKVWTIDEADAERTANRQSEQARTDADMAAAFLGSDGEIPEAPPTREIHGWSAKSRARMVERLCDLDYAPLYADPSRVPAMLTLTYPGCWLRVAPHGKAVKRHMKRFRKRYERAFGETLNAVWKVEFQGRHRGTWCTCKHCDGLDDGRAPHVHLLITPPHHAADDGRPFKQWLSETWAEIVAHPDPEQYANHVKAGTALDWSEGLRCTDPKRMAVYFAKHGSFRDKEYQHCVPHAWREPGKGPGRFWGYWGLEPAVESRSVSTDTGTQAGRILRGHSRAQQVTRQVSRPRAKGGVPISKYPDVQGLAGKQLIQSRTIRYRKTRTRAVRCKNGRGWVSVNDGPAFARQLSTALTQQRQDRHADLTRSELHRCGLADTPLARARRLPPSPRRDRLIERLIANGARR